MCEPYISSFPGAPAPSQRKGDLLVSSLRFLIQRLKPYVVGTALTPGQDLAPDRLEFLTGPMDTLETDRVYLLTCRDIDLLASVKNAPSAVVLVGEVDAASPVLKKRY